MLTATKSQKQLARELQDYNELCQRISQATVVDANESLADREKRLARLCAATVKGFEEFCDYYFPHYKASSFGWFHKRAIRELIKGSNKIMVAEWPRGHAKSIFFNVFVACWKKARKELTGMILVGETLDKACTLLGDVQAELASNQRLIADFGKQQVIGGWSDGKFATADGIGFWAFGIAQNPAGTRKAQRRPNYIVVDDADSRKRAKNQQLTTEAVEWVKGELLGCVTGNDRWDLVVANNRVAKNGLVAHIVGDVNENDPVNPNIIHIKVFAFENPKTHTKLMPEAGGTPAWPEFYTKDKLLSLMDAMDYRSMLRNFYHEDIQDGNVFKQEHIQFCKALNVTKYASLISYCDPSFKDGKHNDFKAIVLAAMVGNSIIVLDIWCRVASVQAMVQAHYDMHERWSFAPIHWMEANMLQDLILDEYKASISNRGYSLPIRADKRAKPNKEQRIEAISGLFERGIVMFNQDLVGKKDYAAFMDQLLAFPHGNHDDGPDALEGVVFMLQRRVAKSDFQPRMGTFSRNLKRHG